LEKNQVCIVLYWSSRSSAFKNLKLIFSPYFIPAETE
jgi:hypothetical protein